MASKQPPSSWSKHQLGGFNRKEIERNRRKSCQEIWWASINFSKHRYIMEGSFYKVVRLDLLLRAEKKGREKGRKVYLVFLHLYTNGERRSRAFFVNRKEPKRFCLYFPPSAHIIIHIGALFGANPIIYLCFFPKTHRPQRCPRVACSTPR